MERFRDSAIHGGYDEVFPPLLATTSLFPKELLDTEEVFSFKDKSQRSICLAPEHTMIIANNVLMNRREKHARLFYILPTFRYERPQKNRYRQFWQLGVENFVSSPFEEIGVIESFASFLESIDVKHVIELNNVGTYCCPSRSEGK